VAVVVVTGMSGTGKSAALAELERRGHRVVDTDYGGYSEEVPSSGPGGFEQVWREDKIEALLDGHDEGVLFVSGCVSNQGKFYPRFDAVVLLSAPAEVILERVAGRESNAFGKCDGERERILDDLASVEPLLRAGATAEIDTRAALEEVVDALERIAGSVPAPPRRFLAKRAFQPSPADEAGMPPLSWTPERLVGGVRPGRKDRRPCQGDRTSRGRTRRSSGVRRSRCIGVAAAR
jgi:dephospho-CoA kinase